MQNSEEMSEIQFTHGSLMNVQQTFRFFPLPFSPSVCLSNDSIKHIYGPRSRH